MTTIQILGISGSEATGKLWSNVVQALREMETKATVEHVTDVDKFIQYKINGIPALVLNGSVVLQKQIPNVEDLKILLNIFAASDPKQFDMKKILLPTDFSEVAKDAYRFALELANIHESSVRVMHVYHPDFDPQNPYLAETMTLQKEISETRLQQFVQPEEEKPLPGNVSTEAVIGFPVEEIIKEAEKASLVVMGTTGESGLLENFFGSVSSNVARRAACPVLLIPGGVHYREIKHILYASDFESANETTLEKLVDFANIFKADIHFVHVTNDSKDKDYQEIENSIFKILFKGNEPSFSFTVSKVEGSSVVSGLNEYAGKHDIDMFVLVAPQRPFWENVFHKSVTKSMVLNTKLPIMVLHG